MAAIMFGGKEDTRGRVRAGRLTKSGWLILLALLAIPVSGFARGHKKEHGKEHHKSQSVRSVVVDAVTVSDRAISPNNDNIQDSSTITVTSTVVLPHMEDKSEHRYANWGFVRTEGVNGDQTDTQNGILDLSTGATGGSDHHSGMGHDDEDDDGHKSGKHHDGNMGGHGGGEHQGNSDFAGTVTWTTIWNPATLDEDTYALQAGALAVRLEQKGDTDLTAIAAPLIDAILQLSAMRGDDDDDGRKPGKIELSVGADPRVRPGHGHHRSHDDRDDDQDRIKVKIKLHDKAAQAEFESRFADRIATAKAALADLNLAEKSKLEIELLARAAYTDQGTIVIDTALPSLQITVPQPSLAFNVAQIQMTALMADSGSGIDLAAIAVTLGGVDVTSSLTTVTPGSISGLLPISGEGAWTIVVTVSDQAGNQTTASVAFVADYTPPVAANLAPSDGTVTNNTTLALQATVSDNLSGINEITSGLEIDGVLVSGMGVPAFVYQPSNGWSDGTHTWRLHLVDHAGNITITPLRSFVIDTVAPTFSGLTPPDRQFTANAQLPLSGQVADALSGLDNARSQLKVDGQPVTIADLGSFSWTAPGGWTSGTHQWEVIAYDLAGNRSTSGIRHLRMNTPPTVQSVALVGNEDQVMEGQVSASDIDGQSLTYSVAQQPLHGTFVWLNATGQFRYLGSQDYFGPDSITVKVNDGYVNSVPATISITLNPVNDAPVAQPLVLSTDEDVAVNGQMVASDVEGDSLTYQIQVAPLHGQITSLDPQTGAFGYLSNQDYNGTDEFSYIANDGALDSAAVTVAVTIVPVNDPPVSGDVWLTLNEDAPMTAATLIGSDVDGDSLQFRWVTPPSLGTVVLDDAATGAFGYTPSLNANGIDQFRFVVSDGTVDSPESVVTVSIIPVNDPPVLIGNSAYGMEDNAAFGTLNAWDPDGDPLMFSIDSYPTHGFLELISPFSAGYVYTPDPNFNGADQFAIRVEDGHGGFATAIVPVWIEPVNDAPVVADGIVTLDENTTYMGVLFGTDVDGDSLEFSIVDGPVLGSVTVIDTATGSYSYAPNANTFGADSFTYRISDSSDYSAIATISITILQTNTPPVADDGVIGGLEDFPINGALSASDADGDLISYQVVSSPQKGTLIVDTITGDYTYTPDPNKNGSDSFTFQVSDGQATSNRATVQITIEPVNDLPVVADSEVILLEDSEAFGGLDGFDIDNDSIWFRLITGTSKGSIVLLDPATGSYQYRPNPDANGSDSFTFVAYDTYGDSNVGTVSFSIIPINDAPRVISSLIISEEDTVVVGQVSAVDAEQDSLTFSVVVSPNHGTLLITNANTGTFVYTPQADFFGSDSATVVANDGSLNSDPGTIQFRINPVDDLPVAATASLTTPVDTLLTGQLNGSDVDGDSLIYLLATAPSAGVVSIVDPFSGDFSYTPNVGFTGTDTFSYKVFDGTNDSSEAVIEIAVGVSTNGRTFPLLAVGDYHSCLITNDRKLNCWGDNWSGQIGDGSGLSPILDPVLVAGDKSWKTVAAGGDHSCAIDGSDTLWCWGANYSGQLGDNSGVDQGLPVQVTGGLWRMVATGYDHTCAIQSDGSLWCWGGNWNGQLGTGDFVSTSVPVQVGTDMDWEFVGNGDSHTCAIKQSGTLWCWGAGVDGQLGTGGFADEVFPVQIGTGTNWQTVAGGISHSCGLTTNGDLFCWGYNGDGELGDGTFVDSTQPVQVTGQWSYVELGDEHSCGIKLDGGLWCWGLNWSGQLGDGTTNDSGVPVQVGSSTAWTAVDGGTDHTCGKQSDETYCWGTIDGTMYTIPVFVPTILNLPPVAYNYSNVWHEDKIILGQLSGMDPEGERITYKLVSPPVSGTIFTFDEIVGTFEYQPDPGFIGSTRFAFQVYDGVKWSNLAWADLTITSGNQDLTIVDVSIGNGHSCALDDNNNLYCWGYNASGQLGNDSATNASTPQKIGSDKWVRVEAAANHTCGIKKEGSLWCWGTNWAGQLGRGTVADSLEPVQVGTYTSWIDISAKYDHTCAIKADNSLWCWGLNMFGQVGNGDQINRLVPTQIAAQHQWQNVETGGSGTCAQQTDESWWCWGRNDGAQLGNGNFIDLLFPEPVSNFDGFPIIQLGQSHGCGINFQQGAYCWGISPMGNSGFQFSTGPSPELVPSELNWLSVSSGEGHNCGLRGDGLIACWGDNNAGQLGNYFTSVEFTVPVTVDVQGRWLGVVVGGPNSCGIRDDRSLWCWGANSFGQIGVGGMEWSYPKPVRVRFTDQNHRPVAYNYDTKIMPGQTAGGHLEGYDPDGDEITFQVIKQGSKGTINITSFGAFDYYSDLNKSGLDRIWFAVFDGQVFSEVAYLDININEPPIVYDSVLSVIEDMPEIGTLSFMDGNQDLLEFEILQNGQKGVFSIIDAALGTFLYTPNPDANGLDVISVRAFDGWEYSFPASIQVQIAPVNDLPVAQNSLYYSSTPTINGTLQASDVDGDILSYSVVTNSGLGLFVLDDPATGAFHYSVAAGTVGSDVIEFIVSDGQGVSNTGRVDIVLAQPPIAIDQSFFVSEDSSYQGILVGSGGSQQMMTYNVFSSPRKGVLELLNASTGEYRYTPNANTSGSDSFAFTVFDGYSESNVATVAVTIVPVNDPPVAYDVAVTVVPDSFSVGHFLRGADVDSTDLEYRVIDAGNLALRIDNSSSGAFSFRSPAQSGTQVFQYRVSDGTTWSQFAQLTVNVVAPLLPPDPVSVAPPLDNGPYNFSSANLFIYSGLSPIQVDVLPGTIVSERLSIVKGRMLKRDGSPLSGTKITITNHPEYGYTYSRSDGKYDLAVNGGGTLTLVARHQGYMKVQRSVRTEWNQFHIVDDIVLTAYDRVGNPLRADLATWQIAESSLSQDSDGSRQVKLLVQPMTKTFIVYSDGTSSAVTDMTFRASEYTVGPQGENAMPAKMPDNIAYTYAAEFSIDEALDDNVRSVKFTKPMIAFTDNFLGMPVGATVPVGSLCWTCDAWNSEKSGLVIMILGTENGVALLDLTGNGIPATPQELDNQGITPDERAHLATMYVPGSTVWRYEVSHLTPYDTNWCSGGGGGTLPKNSQPPRTKRSRENQVTDSDPRNYPEPKKSPKPKKEKRNKTPESHVETKPDVKNNDCKTSGSIIECSNQILQESFPVIGTPFSMVYSSYRQKGYGQPLSVQVSGDTVPDNLLGIDLDIFIAGQRHRFTFPPLPDQYIEFRWDGKDAYGRDLSGKIQGEVRIGWRYPVYYLTEDTKRFDEYRGKFSTPPIPTRTGEGALLRGEDFYLVRKDRRRDNILGWDISVVHSYDKKAGNIYMGDGTRYDFVSQGATIASVSDYFTVLQKAANALRQRFRDFLVAPDGTLYFIEMTKSRKKVLRRYRNNIFENIAIDDSGQYGESLTNGIYSWNSPLSDARFNTNSGAVPDLGPSFYSMEINKKYNILHLISDGGIKDLDLDTGQLKMVAPAKSFVSGECQPFQDGQTVYESRLYFNDIAIRKDGTAIVLARDLCTAQQGIYKYQPCLRDSRIYKIAGKGSLEEIEGVGFQPVESFYPNRIETMSDGSILYSERDRIRRISNNGVIRTMVGGGIEPVLDGVPATSIRAMPTHIVADEKGGFYYVDIQEVEIPRSVRQTIRYVDASGNVNTVVGAQGNVAWSDFSAGSLAKTVNLSGIGVIDLAPDGTLFFYKDPSAVPFYGFDFQTSTSIESYIIYRNFAPGGLYHLVPPGGNKVDGYEVVPSKDGRVLYLFDAHGRHMQTRVAGTNAILYEFHYDANHDLIAIVDSYGNSTSIERNASGIPTAIVSPDGLTTTLTASADGYLAAMQTPAGRIRTYDYDSEGLMTSFVDRNGGQHSFRYNASGRLTYDGNPGGGTKTLVRNDVAGGYNVTLKTALGKTTKYETDFFGNGESRFAVISPSGAKATRLRYPELGLTYLGYADGTKITKQQYKSSSWGGMVDKGWSTITRLPSWLQYESEVSISTTRYSPERIAPLISERVEFSVNGRAYISEKHFETGEEVVTSPAGRVRTNKYDDYQQIVLSQFANFLPTRIERDLRGRVIGVMRGEGSNKREYRIVYNQQGNIEQLIDSIGRVTSFVYDADGRVLEKRFPDGRFVQYNYDDNGNVLSIAPPGRDGHQFGYTPVDLREDYTPPSVGGGNFATHYEFDLDKKLTKVTRPDGQSIDILYDSAQRLSKIESNGTVLSRVQYDWADRPGVIFGLNSAVQFSYDGFLPKSEYHSGIYTAGVSRDYNSDFRMWNETITDGHYRMYSSVYMYDDDGLMVQAGDLVIHRDPLSGFINSTSLGGITTSRTYSNFGELATFNATANSSSLLGYNYQRDKLGRITTKTVNVAGTSNGYSYDYDLSGRLEQVFLNGTPVTTYTYDLNGNRLSRVSLDGTDSGVYDAQDRLTSYGQYVYQYNDNGDLTGKTNTWTMQTTSYQYDVLGNLRTVLLPDGRTIEYVIDGLNRRIGKKVNGILLKAWLYKDALNPIAELDGAGNVTKRFVYGTRSNVPDYMIDTLNNVTYRILSNHLGSPRLIVNSSSGTIVAEMKYDEFGQVIRNTNPGFQPFGFAGGLYDADTGLVRFGSRDYDAYTGRWTTKDPIGFNGGLANLYSYVGGDPVNRIDPAGKFGLDTVIEKVVKWALKKAGNALTKGLFGREIGCGQGEECVPGTPEAPPPPSPPSNPVCMKP